MDKPLDINPQTKIGKLLDSYPELENVLLGLSPSFAKLKNPVLRKTVGRIATLRQVAEIGGLNIGEMISVLRRAIGKEDVHVNIDSSEKLSALLPEWISVENVSLVFDASDIIEHGGNPMKDILEKAGQLQAGEVMLLITPFQPVPIIELLNSKGYQTWSEDNQDNKVYTYIMK